MATNGERKLYKPLPQERKVSSTLVPESEKTLVNIGRAFQENLHKAHGDCQLDTLRAKAALSSSAATKCGGVVHRLRSSSLGMRRAIDIYLPSLSNAIEGDDFSMLQDDTSTSRNQLTGPRIVMRTGRDLTVLSDFDLAQDGLESCSNLASVNRTIAQARRLSQSFNRAALNDDKPTPSTSFASGTFGRSVSCTRR